MVLGCDIAKGLWAAVKSSLAMRDMDLIALAYYFSTHGCALGVSFVCFSGLEVPFAAAAFLALRSKKLAMIDRGQQSCGMVFCCMSGMRC